MLSYDYKVNQNIILEKQKTTKPNLKFPVWLRWFRFILELAANIGIGVAANFLPPGVSIAFEFLASSFIDLIFNISFNGFKLNWEEYSISLGFNAINTINKISRLNYLARKQNKVFSIADNVIEENKELKKAILKNSSSIEKSFGHISENVIAPNYKIFEANNQELLEYLHKQTASSFKTTTGISKEVFSKTSKAITNTKNSILKIKSVFDSIVSPRRAGRKLADLVLKKPKKLFNQKVRQWVKKAFDNKAIKWTGKNVLEQAKDIPVNSSWIDSIKIIRANSLWNVKNVNCLVRFQPLATNHKKPVLLWNKDIKLILDFLNVESPGRHYLNNFAWGWEIGKILRNKKDFIKHINIPLFSTFVSNLAFIQKTIIYFSQTFKKQKWLWNSTDSLTEFTKGVFENSYTGWRFPGSNKIISLARAVQKKNASFVTHTGVRTAYAASYKHKLKNAFKTYTFTRERRKK